MRRRSLASPAVALALLVAAVGGCAERQGPPPKLLVTTTTEAGATTTTLPPTVSTLAPTPVADLGAALDAAIANRDFCAFMAALDIAAPDTGDAQAVIDSYELLDRAVRRAQQFLPAALAESWPAVVVGVDEGLDAAHRVGGNVDDPTLRAPFIDNDFEAAISAAETWQDANCS